MRIHNPADYELVTQFVKGDQRGIEVLIDRHRERVYTYIYLIVKNHSLAEDIFQDTFIKVMRSLRNGRYSDNGKFLSWVLRIAHNLVIDHYRREKLLMTYSKDDWEVDVFNTSRFSDATVEERMIQKQIRDDIRKLLDELPCDQKEVVVMRHYRGLSFKEIAEQTDVSINTALGRMRYALINLRRMIDEKQLSLTLL